MTTPNADGLAWAGLEGQARLLRDGELSAPELLDFVLGRIERLDPVLNAFRSLRPEQASAEAGAAQARLDAGDPAPLLGVPIAVKDNVYIAGEVTAHGTDAVDRPARADSEVVRRLRDAGVVIVGRTNLPELALWGHLTEGPAFGTTRNPWDRERTPGGSSGGSAAAVAAGLVAAAHGSDGGASIRVPAALCGLFGIRPQRDRVPLAPDDDHWNGLTVFGPLARSVVDAALLLDVMAATDTRFADAARREPGRLRVAVSFRPAIRPMRLAREIRAAVEATAELLRDLGHEVHERDPWLPEFGLPLAAPPYTAGAARDAAQLDRPERLERRTRGAVRLGRMLGGRPLRRALRRMPAVVDRINGIFDDHDVLLTPVTARAAPEAGRPAHGTMRTFAEGAPWIAYSGVWALTGQPSAALPVGFDGGGRPLAAQLIARPDDEETLLALAAQLEAARPWAGRKPPEPGGPPR